MQKGFCMGFLIWSCVRTGKLAVLQSNSTKTYPNYPKVVRDKKLFLANWKVSQIWNLKSEIKSPKLLPGKLTFLRANWQVGDTLIGQHKIMYLNYPKVVHDRKIFLANWKVSKIWNQKSPSFCIGFLSWTVSANWQVGDTYLLLGQYTLLAANWQVGGTWLLCSQFYNDAI